MMNDYDAGMQLGAKVEHQVAVRAIATAALSILGKDAADGVINLGALGKWYPRPDGMAIRADQDLG